MKRSSHRLIIKIIWPPDYLTTTRCPICRHQLVARLGARGPYFFCGCKDPPVSRRGA